MTLRSDPLENLNLALQHTGKPLSQMLDDLQTKTEELAISQLVAKVRMTPELTKKIDTLERIVKVIRDGILILFESLRDGQATGDQPELHGRTDIGGEG